MQHQWKQFVENRVTTIRSLVAPDYWRHCPEVENPTDIPSRGMSASALSASSVWLNGPDWLWLKKETGDLECSSQDNVPEDCQKEMKRKDLLKTVFSVSTVEQTVGIGQVIHPERYSSANRLFRVTALVLRYVGRLRKDKPPMLSTLWSEADENRRAEMMWVKDMQVSLSNHANFPEWKRRLDLFKDKDGVWRCGGRMSNSCLTPNAQNPILLDKDHQIASPRSPPSCTAQWSPRDPRGVEIIVLGGKGEADCKEADPQLCYLP